MCAADRAPAAIRLTTGYLPRWRIACNKIGKDESGKGNIEYSNVSSDRVYGVVYEISPSDQRILDEAESLGVGYDAVNFTITTPSGDMRAMTYVARLKDDALRPFAWYRALLIGGAIENQLPRDYIDCLRQIKPCEDPDQQRHARFMRLLAG